MNAASRVLIVDNYDSFTYNLVQYVERIVGRGVRVVKNDDKGFEFLSRPTDLFSNYDLIILAPGPGDPVHDCGCITDFVLESYLMGNTNEFVPLLFGVCMGFEAIGVRLGIPLTRLVPRHGMKWKMVLDHAKDEGTLFSGLPDVIDQVRYHSLTLCPEALFKHPALIVTSSTIDVDPAFAPLIVPSFGPSLNPHSPEWLQKLCVSILDTRSDSHQSLVEIPMSFRHKSLPIYATQFHPESILSEHGYQILENVCQLVKWRLPKGSTESPHPPLPHPNHSFPSLGHPIMKGQLPIDSLPALLPRIFRKFFYCNDGTNIWLDSPPGTTGRWSIMVDTTDLDVYVQRGPHILAKKTGVSQKQTIEDLVMSLEKEIASDQVLQPNIPICAPAIFTFLGYEAVSGSLGGLPSQVPDSVVVVAYRILAIDNDSGDVFASGDTEWSSGILEKISGLHQSADVFSQRELHGDSAPSDSSPLFRVVDSRDCYMEKIRACQTAIAFGESYELCLTTQIESVNDLEIDDPLRLYELMRERNSAPFGAFVEFADEMFSILSVSPELLLKVDNGIAQVRPIKGTRPRGSTEDKDEGIRLELATSEKDIAENLMIVDLVRNDLSQVCTNVVCPKLMQVETFPFYHQLVSTVEGQLVESTLISQCFFRAFPAGSMTGAPKIRSIELLAALESGKRGIGYSGSIGFISPLTRSATVSVVIRTFLLTETSLRRYKVSIGCGGAILGISDPVGEWKEMLTKSRPNLRILGEFFGVEGIRIQCNGGLNPPLFVASSSCSKRKPGRSLIETMRYEAGKGIWLFDKHVDRLYESLRWFDYKVEREEVVESMNEFLMSSMPSVDCLSSTMGDVDGLLGKTTCRNSDWTFISGPSGSWKIRLQVSYTGEWEAKWFPLTAAAVPENLMLCPDVCVDSTQNLLRHKISDWEEVVGVDQKISRESILLVNELGEVTENGIANIAIRRQGEWITPPKASGLLPGTLRAVAIERGLIKVGTIVKADLEGDILCFNSVRGFWLAKVD